MPRKATSQWDFGELFPPAETRRILTVGELTGNIRRLLEKEIGQVWVTGEVTNLRWQSSGHAYFTLKDANAQVNCVLFRNDVGPHRDILNDGQKLIVQGELSVYEPRGQYQLIVRTLEPQGLGALQVAFEKLKRKLQGEGVFAQERKRPLPRYPQRIGLVTSPHGAAIRDVLHVIARRQPGLQIVLVPCRVQGDGAAFEIAGGIRLLNEWNATLPGPERLDLILITRGGGSLEDLWAFNEETVARAIFHSDLPIVSGIGHEIDFTIADFTADLRAATPSAAAELITEGPFACRQHLVQCRRRLVQVSLHRLRSEQDALRELGRRLARVHPRRRLEENLQRLDELQAALFRRAGQSLRERTVTWTHLRERLLRANPAALLKQRRETIVALERRLGAEALRRLRDGRTKISRLEERLRLLSPDNVLARGYSVTLDAATGAVVRDAQALQAGQRLKTRLKSGEATSVVEKTETPSSPSGRN
jgi:exodeoxyribonuclease VII large subunit